MPQPDAGRDRHGATHGEQVIPIVEERLVVARREVNHGSVRIRSYVTTTPVHEQVRLRNERIHVVRRAVDVPLSDVDADAFREHSIELTATGEEAVVSKTVRVVEEVVIGKIVEEHLERIDDTVRRTDVEIVDDTLRRAGAVPDDSSDGTDIPPSSL